MLVLMTSICCTVHSREPFPLVSWNTLPTVCVWSTPRDHSGLRPSASARDILRPHRQWRFFARFFSKCVVLGEMHKTFVCIGFLKMDIKCLIRMYWLSEQYDIMCIYIHRIYIYISYIYHIYSVYIYICLKKSEKSVLCFSFFLHLFQIAKPSIHHRARVAVQRFPLEVAAVLLPCAQQQHDAVAWHAANAANPSAVFFAPSSMAWWRKEVFWGKKGVEALEAPMVDEDIERSTFWWPGNFANH